MPAPCGAHSRLRNARVLGAAAGVPRARLSELLGRAAADAWDALDTALVVLEAPGDGAHAAAEALRAGGAFTYLDDVRLVVAGPRAAYAAAQAGTAGEARAIVDELARAFEAQRKPPAQLRLRAYAIDLRGRATVMGILNVTPDSFYDGGAYRAVDEARRRAAEMVAQGAGIVDIGGQSYASTNRPVSAEEERARVVPVVRALVRDGLGVPLSVDTVRSEVAAAALEAGADLINDCSGLADAGMAAVVAAYDASLVVMHLKGTLNVREPDAYRYDDAMCEILGFLRSRVESALESGVAPESLVVDPGLEFGKEPATDLEILNRFADLRSLGYPILFAASRKTFIGKIVALPASELLVPSLAAAAAGIMAGAGIVRVHDVAETVLLAKMLGAIRAGGD